MAFPKTIFEATFIPIVKILQTGKLHNGEECLFSVEFLFSCGIYKLRGAPLHPEHLMKSMQIYRYANYKDFNWFQVS